MNSSQIESTREALLLYLSVPKYFQICLSKYLYEIETFRFAFPFFPSLSHTNTRSVHKTHFEIQDERIHTTKFVFVSPCDTDEPICKRRVFFFSCSYTIAKMALFIKK